MEVEVEVELDEAEELELGLPVAAPVDMGDTVHNSADSADTPEFLRSRLDRLGGWGRPVGQPGMRRI